MNGGLKCICVKISPCFITEQSLRLLASGPRVWAALRLHIVKKPKLRIILLILSVSTLLKMSKIMLTLDQLIICAIIAFKCKGVKKT